MRAKTVRSVILERVESAVRKLDAQETQTGYAKYHDAPAAFFRTELGWNPWSRQDEIAQALALEDLVSVVSGNGVGKTALASALVWWFVKTRGRDSRVFLTSSKADQSELGIWRAVRQHWLQARDLGRPLGGTLPKLGKTGWRGDDEEQIIVLTGDKAESMQGLRSPKMLIVADEASAIEERIFEAISRNLSGGGKLLLIGNPMRAMGYFFESQKEDSGFARFRISVLDSPNVKEGREVIPGMSTRSFVANAKRQYGEDSPFYKISILGEFVVNEAGKPIPWTFIEDAQKRWADAPAAGVLQFGLDPAGPGQAGDLTAIVWRRGHKMLGFMTGHWEEDAIIRHLLDLVAEHRDADECPRIVVDALGPIGNPVLTRLLGIAKTLSPAKRMAVYGVRASDKAKREPLNYTTMRDELFENLARWIKAEGAIPPHVGLAEELHAPMWIGYGKGMLKLTSKDDIRKQLGRSPDLADALALSVWPVEDPEPARAWQAPPAQPATQNVYRTPEVFNVYRWQESFKPR